MLLTIIFWGASFLRPDHQEHFNHTRNGQINKPCLQNDKTQLAPAPFAQTFSLAEFLPSHIWLCPTGQPTSALPQLQNLKSRKLLQSVLGVCCWRLEQKSPKMALQMLGTPALESHSASVTRHRSSEQDQCWQEGQAMRDLRIRPGVEWTYIQVEHSWRNPWRCPCPHLPLLLPPLSTGFDPSEHKGRSGCPLSSNYLEIPSWLLEPKDSKLKAKTDKGRTNAEDCLSYQRGTDTIYLFPSTGETVAATKYCTFQQWPAFPDAQRCCFLLPNRAKIF